MPTRSLPSVSHPHAPAEPRPEARLSRDTTLRFLIEESRLPSWASRRPERILYPSTRSGRWEFWVEEIGSDRRERVSSRSSALRAGALDPKGEWVWLFEDVGGTEEGRWLLRRFEGDDAMVRTPDVPAGYCAGLAVGEQLAVLGIVDPGGNTTIYAIVPGEPTAVLAHYPLLASVSCLSADESLVCVTRNRGRYRRENELLVLDRAGKTVATLSDDPGSDLRPLAWSPSEGEAVLLLLHERRNQLRPALWHVEEDRLEELELGDEPGAWDVEARWFQDARRLLLLHHTPEGGRLEGLERASGERTRIVPSAVPPEAEILDAAARPDGAVWLEWSTPGAPRQSATLEAPLVPPRDPLPEVVAPMRRARAGAVPIVLTPPAADGPAPLVLLLHGGPARQSRPMWSPEAQSWAAEGFAVIQVNYRGSSGFGRDWREAQRADPGFAEVADLREARRWAVEEGIADPARIVLDGRSWGGYLGLLALGVEPGLWCAGVAELPIADTAGLYQDAMPLVRRMDAAIFGGPPRERPWTYWHRSPLTWAPRIEAPLMLIAASRDGRCPPGQIERFAMRVRSLGRTAELVRFEGGHGPPTTSLRRDLFRARLDFLRRCVPGLVRSTTPGGDAQDGGGGGEGIARSSTARSGSPSGSVP